MIVNPVSSFQIILMTKYISILSFKKNILIPFNTSILKNLGKFLIIELIFGQRKLVKNDKRLQVAKKYKQLLRYIYRYVIGALL